MPAEKALLALMAHHWCSNKKATAPLTHKKIKNMKQVKSQLHRARNTPKSTYRYVSVSSFVQCVKLHRALLSTASHYAYIYIQYLYIAFCTFHSDQMVLFIHAYALNCLLQ